VHAVIQELDRLRLALSKAEADNAALRRALEGLMLDRGLVAAHGCDCRSCAVVNEAQDALAERSET
jgi:hypothetical protein